MENIVHDNIKILLNFVPYLTNFTVDNYKIISQLINQGNLNDDKIIIGLITFYNKNYWFFNNFSPSNDEFSNILSEVLTLSFLAHYLINPTGPFETLVQEFQQDHTLLFYEVFICYSIDEMLSFFSFLNFKELLQYLNDNAVFTILSKIPDPFKHFYESFLLKYNKKLLKKSGSYYSPIESITFITRSLQIIVHEESVFQDSLDNGISFIDPSCGTGSFLVEMINLLAKSLSTLQKSGKRFTFLGFDVNPVSCMLAQKSFHILNSKFENQYISQSVSFNNISPIAQVQNNDRVISHSSTITTSLESLNSIRSKSSSYQVVFGNPPYSAVSNNNNEWINNLLKGNIGSGKQTTHNYFEVNGESIKEKKSGWLYDDYVKFIRLGHWLIDRSESGILSFICNNSFLSNPSFRGMRFQLLSSFDEFYILDLHGNIKIDTPPYDVKDENIFAITQGICIFFFIKNRLRNSDTKKFFFFDYWGSKVEKLKFLQSHDISTISWREFSPRSPFYTFFPEDQGLGTIYSTFWSINDIFNIKGTGLITSKDNLTIQFTKEELFDILKDFISMDPESAREKYKLGPDTENWKVFSAQNDIKEHGLKNDLISTLLYRPFDIRYTFFTGKANGFHGRPKAISKELFHTSNIALVSARTNKTGNNDHFFVSSTLTEAKCAEFSTQSYVFPLKIFDEHNYAKNNIQFSFIRALLEIPGFQYDDMNKIKGSFNDHDILAYIYAICYSYSYRSTFKSFFLYDFPKIPVIKDLSIFTSLVTYGHQLFSLHLLDFETPGESKIIDTISKEKTIKDVFYKESKLYINKEEYFYPIEPIVYNYTIGNYKVLKKWLLSRKNRVLSNHDIIDFKKIVYAITETINIVNEINKININFF